MSLSKSILGPALFVCMAVNLYLIFMFAPTESSMGQVQRIFYFHVPTAWVSGLSLSVVFIASILYLWKRQRKYDIVAHSAGEIGVLFMTLFLTTGPIWARPVWNIWWDWSPRLTLSLVLWFIFVAYLMLRNFVEGEDKGARGLAWPEAFGHRCLQPQPERHPWPGQDLRRPSGAQSRYLRPNRVQQRRGDAGGDD